MTSQTSANLTVPSLMSDMSEQEKLCLTGVEEAAKVKDGGMTRRGTTSLGAEVL